MKCQKDEFNLDHSICYLNGAYMSPLLKETEAAGIHGLKLKNNPHQITSEDFFIHVDRIRRLFCDLINADIPDRVVVVPSASYALANAANNLPKNGRNKIVVLEEQFPSNYFIWQRVAQKQRLSIDIVKKPKNPEQWEQEVLSRIDKNTLAVAMGNIHWADGTVFNIETISSKCRDKGVIFVLDGTQSIGAYPFNQARVNANVIVTSAYKWLLGPYGIGFAFYDDHFDHGRPIEESWLNRMHSDDFQYLTNYQSKYRSGSRRYEVGEAADFIKMPMVEASLTQLLAWGPNNIQNYCRKIVSPVLEDLQSEGFIVGTSENKAYHLFGIRIPSSVDMTKVKMRLLDERIFVSFRQDVIRVSPNVYNTPEELVYLKECLIDVLHNS